MDDTPVLARDTWQNTVDIAGADFRICAPADPDCTGGGTTIDGDETDGVDDLDASSAGQEAAGLTIDKRVREVTPGPVDCATGNYIDGPPPSYGPGDTVCWQLRIDFAALLDSGDPLLTDFLPPGVTYVPRLRRGDPGQHRHIDVLGRRRGQRPCSPGTSAATWTPATSCSSGASRPWWSTA